MSNLVLARNGRTLKKNANPFLGMSTLSSLLNDIWNEDLPTVHTTNFHDGMTLPKVNIRENTDGFHLEMAVPGFKKNDFNISVEKDELVISAEVKTEKEIAEENFTRKEFGYGSFQRTFVLPETVDSGKIGAKYEDGILSIAIPKKEEAKPKPARVIKIS